MFALDPISSAGVILIDKPSGMSSHAVVNTLRRYFGVKCIGHAGTLDPLASGLLICLVGREFTRQQDTFLKQPKVYVCQFQVGRETETYDRLGRVTHQANWPQLAEITQSQVENVLAEFVGTHTQQVPAFSAVKIHGRKLYEQARLGHALAAAQLPSRQVTITQIQLTNWQVDKRKKTLIGTMEIACGSGTYIRSLVHDLGQKLGTGACVTELRRLSIGEFKVTAAHQLAEYQSTKNP